LPDADPDGDRLCNAVEFALGGSPAEPDRAEVSPSGTIVAVGPASYPALTFRLRKELSGATATLEGSGSIPGGSWGTIWTSDDLTGPLVVERVDQGALWRLTVRDTAPLPPGPAARYLRLRLTLPP
jgi:hypothetical protein